MMYEKCTLGYLTKRKKAEILWIVFFVVLGVAIFLTGYLWSGVRANIFTVMAVLLVLPAAKHLVALIAMFRKKGVTKERYDKVKSGFVYRLCIYLDGKNYASRFFTCEKR